MNIVSKNATSLALAAVLGFAVLIIPVIGVPVTPDVANYFLPIVLLAFKNISLRIHLPLLFVAGFIPGLLSPASFWAVGFATIIVLPIWSVLDMVDASIDGIERHNLFPIEWFLYSILSLPGMAGAWAAKLVRRKWVTSKQNT